MGTVRPVPGAPSPVKEQTGARSEELRPEPGARVST